MKSVLCAIATDPESVSFAIGISDPFNLHAMCDGHVYRVLHAT